MLTETIQDKRAWRADTIDDSDSWKHGLSSNLCAHLEDAIQQEPSGSCAVTDFLIEEEELTSGRTALQPVLDALEAGPGFAIVERVPVERYSLDEAQAMYWLIGLCLGQPFEQNVEGTLLYDVRDMGHQVDQGARFSVTNAESSFHTDNAFGRSLPDYVGLLCFRTAKSGGRSQLVSAYSLHSELLTNHPDALQTLYQPFYFDRRGQFADAELPYSRNPIFGWDGCELTTRYLHYYIEVGHEKAGEQLSPAQISALDVLKDLLNRQEFRVEFDLEPGQMLFTNNRWILHNRTAFEDHSDPERRRHYIRLWLSRSH